jgi:hypothetical protein
MPSGSPSTWVLAWSVFFLERRVGLALACVITSPDGIQPENNQGAYQDAPNRVPHFVT